MEIHVSIKQKCKVVSFATTSVTAKLNSIYEQKSHHHGNPHRKWGLLVLSQHRLFSLECFRIAAKKLSERFASKIYITQHNFSHFICLNASSEREAVLSNKQCKGEIPKFYLVMDQYLNCFGQRNSTFKQIIFVSRSITNVT